MPSQPKKHIASPVATIDLHGYKRDQCIASVTAFLESSQKQFPPPSACWVCIITGSGHHSPAGPVLRDAVQALLEKREMEYTLPRGKGSFLVNCHSGHKLVSAPPLATCSKVQVVKSSSTDTNNVNLVNRPVMPRRLGDSATTTITARNVVAPKPCEVAADDVLVARVKQTSHDVHAHQKRHEEIQLKQALTASKREFQQQDREEETCLKAILEQSQREEELRHEQEQQHLEEILQHSRNEEERIQQLEQEKLQEILHLSQQEQQHQQIQHDDEQLNQVLQQSLQDVHAIDDELNRALTLSLQECHKQENDVRLGDDKVSAASLELSIAESTTIEMLEKQVGYVIEEVD